MNISYYRAKEGNKSSKQKKGSGGFGKSPRIRPTATGGEGDLATAIVRKYFQYEE